MMLPMEWVVLGSGTLEMSPDRGPACHLLYDSATSVLVDTGPGCLDRLAKLSVDPTGLQAVVHSHLHLDHLADLFPLLFHRCLQEHRLSELVLSGGPEHEPRLIQVARTLYPKLLQGGVGFHGIEPNGRLRPLPGTPLRVAAWPADHNQEARILRFEGSDPEPWSLCYSGDTGPCSQLREAAEGVDWLVIECTTPDDSRRDQHLTPEDVALVIDQAGPKGTALVHLSPLWDSSETAAAVVRAHLGALRLGSVPYVVGGFDGLALPLPFGQPYSHSMVPGGLDETS